MPSINNTSINNNNSNSSSSYNERRTSPLPLIYLAGLSAIIVYSYDTVLDPFFGSYSGGTQIERNVLGGRNLNLGKERRLQMEKRVSSLLLVSWHHESCSYLNTHQPAPYLLSSLSIYTITTSHTSLQYTHNHTDRSSDSNSMANMPRTKMDRRPLQGVHRRTNPPRIHRRGSNDPCQNHGATVRD